MRLDRGARAEVSRDSQGARGAHFRGVDVRRITRGPDAHAATFAGRPGLNPLRFTTTQVTTEAGWPRSETPGDRRVRRPGRRRPGSSQSMSVFGTRVVVGRRPGRSNRAEPGRPRRNRRRRAQRGPSRRLYGRDRPRPRGRSESSGPGAVPRHVRESDDRRRRRRFRRPWPARAARHRDLQGQADPVQRRRLHLPERDAAAPAGARITSRTTSDPRPRSPTSTAGATATTRPGFRPIRSSGRPWWPSRSFEGTRSLISRCIRYHLDSASRPASADVRGWPIG